MQIGQLIKQSSQQSDAIDFHTMLAKERIRAKSTLTVKVTASMQVFNMLQDMRHLIIIDLRESEDYAQSHIRKSISA